LIPLPRRAACGEVVAMTLLHARIVAMTAASAVANEHVRALNNNNANNNTRNDGWAGV
jgi:hypothetical protein